MYAKRWAGALGLLLAATWVVASGCAGSNRDFDTANAGGGGAGESAIGGAVSSAGHSAAGGAAGGTAGGSAGSTGGAVSIAGSNGEAGEAGAAPVRECTTGEKQPCWEASDGTPIPTPQPTKALGNCRLGEQVCNIAGTWAKCEGAIGPSSADTCVAGDDASCNGVPNEGCSCVEGTSRACGSAVGSCKQGMQTCTGAKWGDCMGEVKPLAVDSCVTAGDDANCNGLPNDGCPCVGTAKQDCGDCGSQTCAPATRQWGACGPAKPTRPCGTCGTQACGSNGVYATCVPAAPQCINSTQLHTCPATAAPDWVTKTCTYACTGNACGGLCVPGTKHCALSPERRELCDSDGKWTLIENCAAGSSCQGNGTTCLKNDGVACAGPGECADNTCTVFYPDTDKDGYGTGTSIKVCGTAPPVGYAPISGDCCDTDKLAHPGATAYYPTANKCGNFDYNCINGDEIDPANSATVGRTCNLSAQTCFVTKPGWDYPMTCGQTNAWAIGCHYAVQPIAGPYCAGEYDGGHPQFGCH